MGLLDELSSIIVTPAPGTSDGGGGGGGDPTNLNSVEAPSTVTITSSTGANAVIPAADASNAGVFLPTEKDKLTNIAAGATANSTDAFLLDRTNHTGTQAQSTIVGLATTLGLKADLVDGKVPSAQIPGSFDDVLEFADFASLPGTGEASKIYITLDDNRQYRWSGSAYVQLNGGLALGETSATAYRGDRGKIAYDHSQIVSGNPHNTTTGDIPEVTDKRFLTDAERTAIATNSSKVTNATHTGDVAGDTALTLQAAAVTGKTLGTPTTGDVVLFARGGALYYGDVAAFLAGGGTWGSITGTLSNQTDLQGALDAKISTETDPVFGASEAANITAGDITNLGNLSGTNTGDQDLSGLMVKASNLSDLVNAATARTNLGVDAAGTDNSTPVTLVTGGFTFLSLVGQEITLSAIAQSEVTGLTTALAGKEPTITAGTTGQYWRGDKSFQALDKAAVGLGNVVNLDTSTTTNITDAVDKRFVTDAEQTVLGNTSGINTGDMTPVEVNNAASPYAAVDKQRIAALSSTGAININLPASGAAAVIDVSDKDFAAHTNTITITPDGTDTINGLSLLELTTAGAHVGLAIAAGSTDWYLYFFSDNTDVSSVPVGSIHAYPSTTAPDGELKLNGSLLSRIAYPKLYAFALASGNIYTEAEWATKKGGFSTGDLSTTFRIPDLRGEFVRAWDDSAGIDGGRVIGSNQADAFRAHSHQITGWTGNTNNAPGGHFLNTNQFNTTAGTTTNVSTPAGDTETRPRSIALLYCIKY